MKQGKSTKANSRNMVRSVRIAQTADILGLSKRYVRYVLSGDRENEEVLKVYMGLQEGESKLLQTVRQLVPLN